MVLGALVEAAGLVVLVVFLAAGFFSIFSQQPYQQFWFPTSLLPEHLRRQQLLPLPPLALLWLEYPFQ